MREWEEERYWMKLCKINFKGLKEEEAYKDEVITAIVNRINMIEQKERQGQKMLGKLESRLKSEYEDINVVIKHEQCEKEIKALTAAKLKKLK